MIRIGITGGICTGKSTVCSYIESLGYSVYYTDQAAIALAENMEDLKSSIIEEFGVESYLEDGSYNRKYIAGIVFSDKNRLDKINSIFAPYLLKMFDLFCENKEIIFYESALIFEHNLQGKFDFIISTYADIYTVTQRMITRNGFTNTEINNRLSSQLDAKLKVEKSDFTIDTTNGEYKEQVKLILDQILDKNLLPPF